MTEEWVQNWNTKMEEAATNIGKCLDGLLVYEANYVLCLVKKRFLDGAVIHGSDGRETES